MLERRLEVNPGHGDLYRISPRESKQVHRNARCIGRQAARDASGRVCNHDRTAGDHRAGLVDYRSNDFAGGRLRPGGEAEKQRKRQDFQYWLSTSNVPIRTWRHLSVEE